MGSKKNFVKGLAAGAVLGAVASMVMAMRNTKEAHELGDIAEKIKNRVAKHAKKVGKLTKSAYGNVVEKTVAEYRGAKALSDSELTELKDELKDSWVHLQAMLAKKKTAPKGKKK